MQNRTLFGFLCIFTFLLTVFLAPTWATEPWVVQTVAEQAWTGGHCPIVVDSNGTAHIAYPHPHTDGIDVTYATRNGSSWIKQVVDTGDYGFKKVLDLALDREGYPWLVFSEHPSESLGVTKWNGKSWDSCLLGEISGEATLAFDSFGNPYLVYTTGVKFDPYSYQWVGSALKYASWSGAVWSIKTVGSDINATFTNVSLVFDKDNRPYILCRLTTESNSTVKLAVTQNSKWRIKDAPLPVSVEGCGNIVVDSQSKIHFVCRETYIQNLTRRDRILYVSYSDDEWDTQTLVSDILLDAFYNLVLDNQGNPHFTYSCMGEGSYVTCSDGSWKNLALPSNVKAGGLAIDQYGNIHLSTRTRSAGRYLTDLVYASAPETLLLSSGDDASNIVLTVLAAATVVIILMGAGVTAIFWKKRKRA